jgi:putative CocE/NonD family hydrolase
MQRQWREMLRFYDAYLKGIDCGFGEEKILFYYTLGEERWKATHTWPPEGAVTQRWYLREGNAISLESPTENEGADVYPVDFEANTGDFNRWWEMAVLEEQSVYYGDRAEAGERLLTYTSPPLEDDMEISGYPLVKLYVTSTETDGAFFVYLEDVHPDGRVTYISEGCLRAVHRKASDEPAPYVYQMPYNTFMRVDMEALVPGEVTELSLGLQPISVLLWKGHRLRVSIAGHDEGTFKRVPEEGEPVIEVLRNSVQASYIDLPVIEKWKNP